MLTKELIFVHKICDFQESTPPYSQNLAEFTEICLKKCSERAADAGLSPTWSVELPETTG